MANHYDNRGWMDYVEDAAGNRTAYAYDEVGRRVAETNAAAGCNRYEYDLTGHVVRVWGDAPYPVAYAYDEYGRMSGMSTYRGGSGWTNAVWPTNTTGDADTT